MAFETSAFTTAADLQSKMETFLGNQSYTQHGTNTYQRGNSFYHKMSVVSDIISDNLIKVTIGDGIDGGNNPTQTFTQEPPALREISSGTYWAFDDGNMTYFVVRYSSGLYQHLAMGEFTKKVVGSTNGALTIASRTSWNSTSELTTRANIYLCSRASSRPIEDVASVGGIKYNGAYYDQNLGRSGSYLVDIGISKVCFCLGNELDDYDDPVDLHNNPYNEKVKSSARSDNGMPVFSAVLVSAPTDSEKAEIVGDLPSVRHTNIKEFEAGTSINFGSDEWVMFPTYDASQEDYGFAYKK